jgi:anthranilate phosphoribosyltransferase
VSLAAPTEVIEVNRGGQQSFVWRPEDFEIATASHDALRIKTADQSAAVIRRILAGERGPPRDIVVLNAAAAFYAAGSDPILACTERAAESIDSGAAQRLLERWVKLSASA